MVKTLLWYLFEAKKRKEEITSLKKTNKQPPQKNKNKAHTKTTMKRRVQKKY